MRVVLDCNVVISAARTDGACRAAIVAAVRHHEIVLSAPILEEYRVVAVRPKHAHCRNVALSVIDELEAVAAIVIPDVLPPLPDRDDTIYLGTALAGKADALITGNVRHFPPEVCGPVRILTPRAFLDRLSSGR